MTRLNIPLFVALAASILSAVPVDGSRETLPHQRMIRKRGPGPIEHVVAYDHGIHARQLPTASSAASASAASSTPATSASPTSAAASSTAAAATTTSAESSSTPATTSSSTSSVASTSSGGLLDSLTNLLSTTSSTVSTSSVPSTTSVAPTTSSSVSVAPETTAAAATTPAPSLNLATAAPTSTTPRSVSVVLATTSLTAVEASQSAAAEKKAKITKNTIISLVVIASCIGGAIAIWTVIRKWKLSPSEKFDDRMQPIDWAPQGAAGAHEETMEEKRHRRVGSAGSHGSFTSGGVAQSETGHGKAMSEHSHAYGAQGQDFPPPHDFTAGTQQPGYGQYYGGQQYAGGAGYADLQRGPSVSESTYSHGASVTRGMSYSRGPTAGYEAQPGAGGVPPLPNPYGGEYGYDDYGHQAGQAGQQPQAQAQPQVPYRGYN